MRTEKKRSPGEVKGQCDVQRRSLEAVFGAHRKLGRLSISPHGDNL